MNFVVLFSTILLFSGALIGAKLKNENYGTIIGGRVGTNYFIVDVIKRGHRLEIIINDQENGIFPSSDVAFSSNGHRAIDDSSTNPKGLSFIWGGNEPHDRRPSSSSATNHWRPQQSTGNSSTFVQEESMSVWTNPRKKSEVDRGTAVWGDPARQGPIRRWSQCPSEAVILPPEKPPSSSQKQQKAIANDENSWIASSSTITASNQQQANIVEMDQSAAKPSTPAPMAANQQDPPIVPTGWGNPSKENEIQQPQQPQQQHQGTTRPIAGGWEYGVDTTKKNEQQSFASAYGDKTANNSRPPSAIGSERPSIITALKVETFGQNGPKMPATDYWTPSLSSGGGGSSYQMNTNTVTKALGKLCQQVTASQPWMWRDPKELAQDPEVTPVCFISMTPGFYSNSSATATPPSMAGCGSSIPSSSMFYSSSSAGQLITFEIAGKVVNSVDNKVDHQSNAYFGMLSSNPTTPSAAMFSTNNASISRSSALTKQLSSQQDVLWPPSVIKASTSIGGNQFVMPCSAFASGYSTAWVVLASMTMHLIISFWTVLRVRAMTTTRRSVVLLLLLMACSVDAVEAESTHTGKSTNPIWLQILGVCILLLIGYVSICWYRKISFAVTPLTVQLKNGKAKYIELENTGRWTLYYKCYVLPEGIKATVGSRPEGTVTPGDKLRIRIIYTLDDPLPADAHVTVQVCKSANPEKLGWHERLNCFGSVKRARVTVLGKELPVG